MGALNGKVAVVLGAAGHDNMGQVIAARFAQDGARVIVAGRGEDELRRCADAIGGSWTTGDITGRADLDKLATFAKDRYGPVDVAVNATGWGLLAPFLDTSEDDLVKIMRDPNSMVGSDGEVIHFGVAAPHPRGYGTFVRVLGRYTLQRRRLLGVERFELDLDRPDAIPDPGRLPSVGGHRGQPALRRFWTAELEGHRSIGRHGSEA